MTEPQKAKPQKPKRYDLPWVIYLVMVLAAGNAPFITLKTYDGLIALGLVFGLYVLCDIRKMLAGAEIQ